MEDVMKSLMVFAAAVVFVLSASHTALAQISGAAAPSGSYQRICDGIAFDATTNTLSANCNYQMNDAYAGGMTVHTPYHSSLVTSYCAQGTDISSIRSRLQCLAAPGTYGYQGAVPKGSYQQSCMWWSVTGSTLSAMCWTFVDGKINYGNDVNNPPDGWVIVTVNLTQCDMTRDIENIQGQLVCSPRPVSQATLSIANAATNMHAAPRPAPPQGPDLAKVPRPCLQGFVWRQAVAMDYVCVTSQTRAQAAADDKMRDQRIAANDMCIQGYVWRMTVPLDHVCVTPQTRDQAQQDNAAMNERVAK
jgi:hypothetical protein